MSVEDTAKEILASYEFGRFVQFYERLELLRDYFTNHKMDESSDAIKSARHTVESFCILDQIRFKEALDWAISGEGDIPDMWMRRRHLNVIPELGDGLYQYIPFYGEASSELREAAAEFFQLGLKFYKIDKMNGGSAYRYNDGNLEKDTERAIVLARTVLDTAHEHINREYVKGQ
jgi:hypothetical protein